jgi:hypothetical protein
VVIYTLYKQTYKVLTVSYDSRYTSYELATIALIVTTVVQHVVDFLRNFTSQLPSNVQSKTPIPVTEWSLLASGDVPKTLGNCSLATWYGHDTPYQ